MLAQLEGNICICFVEYPWVGADVYILLRNVSGTLTLLCEAE